MHVFTALTWVYTLFRRSQGLPPHACVHSIDLGLYSVPKESRVATPAAVQGSSVTDTPAGWVTHLTGKLGQHCFTLLHVHWADPPSLLLSLLYHSVYRCHCLSMYVTCLCLSLSVTLSVCLPLSLCLSISHFVSLSVLSPPAPHHSPLFSFLSRKKVNKGKRRQSPPNWAMAPSKMQLSLSSWYISCFTFWQYAMLTRVLLTTRSRTAAACVFYF